MWDLIVSVPGHSLSFYSECCGLWSYFLHVSNCMISVNLNSDIISDSN